MASSTQAPDLDSILATLRALTDQTSQILQPEHQNTGSVVSESVHAHQNEQHNDNEEDDYEPPDVIPTPQPVVSLDPRKRSGQQHVLPNGQSARAAPRSDNSKPDMDATFIIDWQRGLRHVTKLAARNDQLGRSIQKMIRNQRDNERQWWAGREALLVKQKSRVENNAKLNEVLRNVVPSANQVEAAAVDEKAELHQYDLKVWRCQDQMTKAFFKNLRELGVPFFETDPALVQPNEDAETGESSTIGPRRISRQDLRGLQMKMIQYLEDMYGD